MISSGDIFDYAVGALAIASAFLSVALYSRSYLPGVQIKVLEKILKNTKEIYQEAEADCALPPGRSGTATKGSLESLECRVNGLKVQAYNVTSLFEEYMAMLRGLSGKISQEIRRAKAFRAYLITASEQQRQLQRQSRRSMNSQQPAAVNVVSPSSQHPPVLLSEQERVGASIERPRSCPAPLSVASYPCTVRDTPAQPGAARVVPDLDATSQISHTETVDTLPAEEQISRSSTLVENCLTSVRIPFTKLYCYFGFPNKDEPTKELQTSENQYCPDTVSLPV